MLQSMVNILADEIELDLIIIVPGSAFNSKAFKEIEHYYIAVQKPNDSIKLYLIFFLGAENNLEC